MSREADLYKDKIEVSLDGRQIFYLFFGGAVIVGLVFVLGVMVGRRVEARGHVDRARTTAAVDPLAALDRLEGNGGLSFKGALMNKSGAPTPASDVERAIDEIEKQRIAKGDAKAPAKPDVLAKADAKTDAKPDAKVDAKVDSKLATKPESKVEAKPELKLDAKPVVKPDGKSDAKLVESKSEVKSDSKADVKSDKPADLKSDKSAEKSDKVGVKSDKPVDVKPDKLGVKLDKPVDVKPDVKSDKPVAKAPEGDKPVTKPDDAKPVEEKKPKYTLQLSSFQDKAEADAFLSSVKASGYQAYVTEASVAGKGTFYRVRMGTYKSIEAANDAKAEFEKSSKKSASVMKL